MTDEAAATPGRGLLDRAGQLLDSPLTGLSPWIVLAVLEGPGMVAWASGIALALSVLFLALDLARGRSMKLLSVLDVAFFAGLLALVLVVPMTQDFLEIWVSEISNIALVLIAVGSILVRSPFTLPYAREQVERQYWDSPVFLRVNYVITGAWAVAFLIAAIAGFYGDAVLRDNNNLWTGWVIQIAAIVVALQFSSWYPDVAKARAEQAAGQAVEVPSLSGLLGPLTVWLIPIGVLALVFDSGPTWLGIALIVVGAVLGKFLPQGPAPEANAATRED
jgi:hypothetical protein